MVLTPLLTKEGLGVVELTARKVSYYMIGKLWIIVMLPKLSIIFLNYNRLSETRYTLSHLRGLLESRQGVEVIAIDNGSTDGTLAFLQSQSDWVRVISLPTNTGIAGYNEGFKLAQGDYLLVLDDDSHPVDNTTLDRIVQCLDTRPEVGVVACRIETLQGHSVYSWHLPKLDLPGESMAFVGCGFAIRRQLFEQIGWYPAEFFLYQNEIEVAIRVMQRNYKIYYDPQCRVIHRHSPQGRTHWRRVYYPTRNTIWVIRRYFPWPGAAYLIASRLSFGLVRAIQARDLRCYYQAVREGLLTPIEFQELSPALLKQLTGFWRQNSLWHQIFGIS